MTEDNKLLIDILSPSIQATLSILLLDKTTKKNIIWATDSYKELGPEYDAKCEITKDLVSGFNKHIIQPRVSKSLETQAIRTKQKAEVMTPSWICCKMNNHCDDEWFGKPNLFNEMDGTSWVVTTNPIEFPPGKTWIDYVDSRRIEITCGEAPYIISRYDTTTGEYIPINNRIGILDRKLRVVNENAKDDEEWLKWAIKAFQSVYGYEWQGDNLLIARLNAIETFAEYYQQRFNDDPDVGLLKKVANIIAWNFWQMDGITGTIPYGTPEEEFKQLSMFDLMFEEKEKKIETPVCRIYDWKANRSLLYTDLKRG